MRLIASLPNDVNAQSWKRTMAAWEEMKRVLNGLIDSPPFTGSVSSVGLAMPAEFVVSGSPVTTTGTLTAALANQAANLVWAGPTSGSPAPPTFRALVAGDVPSLPYLPSSTVLPLTFGAVAQQFLASYNAATGAFTAAQPAYSDLSGSPIFTGMGSGVGFVIDGAGSTPTTGSKKFSAPMPYAGTITAWTILADVSGSAQVTVKKASYAAFPTTSSIVAAAPITLTTAQKNTSSTLTGWTTSVSVNDIFEINLDSVSTVKWLMVFLSITRS